MRRLACLALCLLALLGVAACGNFYDDLANPEARFSPGDQ